MTPWSFFGLAIAIGASAAGEAPPKPKPVEIDAATMRRLAIVVAPVPASIQSANAGGFARVLDPIPLAQLDADIAAAAPAAAASTAEAARSRALFAADATVSRRVADAAMTQASGDSAKLTLLRRRLGLEWGPAIARLGDGPRSALVASLASGRAALVRIDSSGGVGQASLTTATLDLGELGTVTARILGPARTADPRLQSPGLIALVSGSKASLLSSGLSVPVRLGGAARSGVLVPSSAILRVEGATWVYVQLGDDLVRRRLNGMTPVTGGLFVTGGLRAGERIASHGAAALYAAEKGGRPVDD